ncbi:MAG: GTP cyclohydrolase II, partial [Spirochaetota bacterium]
SGDRVFEIARDHGLPLVSVEDLVRYRSFTGDTEVVPIETTPMPTRYGMFSATVWSSRDPGCREIVTISSLEERAGDGAAIGVGDAPLVRLHSECLTGEAFGSHRCDCGPQLDAALAAIGREPGLVVYLRQEGRGIGLVDKFRAYALQDGGLDTVDANVELGHRADERSYAAATAVLHQLGLDEIRLMTNNPDKYEAVLCSGIRVQRIGTDVGRTSSNARYLETKVLRMGHEFTVIEALAQETSGRKQ